MLEKILMDDLKDHMSAYIQRQGFVGKRAADAIDYREKSGVLNPVKNQGQCGSCWAFSTTAVLESNIAIAKGTLYNFAEQQLVDCCGDKGYECLGCNGAWPEWALNYVNAEGIVSQSEYAYTAKKAACKATPTAKKFLNSAKPWVMLQREDQGALKNAISATGPVSICIDASNWSLYRSGVFSNCGTKTLNHAVLAVGYQADGVWIVRNSWGASWGEQGYIRLSAGNTCGITEHAVIPNLA